MKPYLSKARVQRQVTAEVFASSKNNTIFAIQCSFWLEIISCRIRKIATNAVEDSESVRILRHFTHSVEAGAEWTGLEPSFSSVYNVLPAAICIRP